MHNRSNLSLAVLSSVALIAGALAVACGDDEKGSGPDSVSSVDSDKTANSLSDSEAKQYCEDAQAYYAEQFAKVDTKRLTCGYTAQLMAGIGAEDDATAQAKCREQFDECMNKPVETGDAGAPTTGDDKDDCSTAKTDLADCSATVGELNQCAADQVAAYKALASKDFCAEAKAGGSTDAQSPFTTPASCEKISSKCHAIDDISGGDSDG